MLKLLKYTLLSITCMICCYCEEDISYSCDPQTDIWVKKNLHDIKVMTRSQWKNLESVSLKKACYGVFSKNQRIKFWNEKLMEVLTLNWNQSEKNHILELLNFVNNHTEYFSSNELSDTDYEIIDSFIYLWNEKAVEELHWNSKIIYAISVCGEKMLDKEGNLETINNVSEFSTQNETPDCICSKKSDWCDMYTQGIKQPTIPTPITPGIKADCGNIKCNSGGHCGTLLLYTCDGSCIASIVTS